MIREISGYGRLIDILGGFIENIYSTEMDVLVSHHQQVGRRLSQMQGRTKGRVVDVIYQQYFEKLEKLVEQGKVEGNAEMTSTLSLLRKERDGALKEFEEVDFMRDLKDRSRNRQ